MAQPTTYNEGGFLRARREELGMSQGDLAMRMAYRKVKLSRRDISEWENGKRAPALSVDQLKLLAEALRWKLDDLLEAMKIEREEKGEYR
jgi:transcriptional regulator with XRE-family HTH domain